MSAQNGMQEASSSSNIQPYIGIITFMVIFVVIILGSVIIATRIEKRCRNDPDSGLGWDNNPHGSLGMLIKEKQDEISATRGVRSNSKHARKFSNGWLSSKAEKGEGVTGMDLQGAGGKVKSPEKAVTTARKTTAPPKGILKTSKPRKLIKPVRPAKAPKQKAVEPVNFSRPGPTRKYSTVSLNKAEIGLPKSVYGSTSPSAFSKEIDDDLRVASEQDVKLTAEEKPLEAQLEAEDRELGRELEAAERELLQELEIGNVGKRKGPGVDLLIREVCELIFIGN
jgi:hypothetical protein